MPTVTQIYLPSVYFVSYMVWYMVFWYIFLKSTKNIWPCNNGATLGQVGQHHWLTCNFYTSWCALFGWVGRDVLGVLSRLVSSRLVSSRLVSSRLVSSRLVSSRLVSSRLVSSRLVSSRLVSSRLVSSRLVSSRLVSSRHFIQFVWVLDSYGRFKSSHLTM